LLQCLVVGSSIVEFKATDDDKDLEYNARVTYTLQATDNPQDLDFFRLDPITGILKSLQRFDRLRQQQFQVGIVPC
jgi:hypothetical protein